MKDKERIYNVVQECEDDPWCAHWLESRLMTDSYEKAVEYIVSNLKIENNRLMPLEGRHLFKIEVFEYDASDTVLKKVVTLDICGDDMLLSKLKGIEG